MLTIKNLSFHLAGQEIFKQVSIQVGHGDKVGLIGRNGIGKSTLFKLITGEYVPDSGEIDLWPKARIGFLSQEADSTSESLIDYVLAADEERASLMREAETAEDPDRIADIHLRLSDIDAHSAPARAASILHGLGFNDQAQQRKCNEFSGGWRMRIALAAILFKEPDLLMLDEPTNYLDLEGTLWLEQYIARYPHTVIIISHDRDLLNKAVKTICHVSRAGVKAFTGNFDQFEENRRLQQVLDTKAKIKQDAKRAHLEKFVERFRYKNTKARQAQSRLKVLAKMQPIAAEIDGEVTPFTFADPEKTAAPPLIHMEKVSTGYHENEDILSSINLRLDPDDRIALLGANGNGKSTFAKLLVDRMPFKQGKITRSNKLKIAFFAQHHLDDLSSDQSAYEHVTARLPDLPESKVRAKVASMGLSREKMDTKCKNLSGGERARLAMGLATLEGSHLLILDEPTNHLDIDSRQALIEALNAFQGALVLISHDQHLIEACAERLWLVADGRVKEYDGDMDQYRSFILNADSQKKANRKEAQDNPGNLPFETNRKARRQEQAQQREATANVRKTIKVLEKNIAECEDKIAQIDNQLADGTLYVSDSEKASQLSIERAKYASRLSESEDEWLILSQKLEQD